MLSALHVLGALSPGFGILYGKCGAGIYDFSRGTQLCQAGAYGN